MRNIIHSILMVLSISVILTSAVKGEEIGPIGSERSVKEEIPGCNAPMVFGAMPSGGRVISLRNNDVTLTDEQVAAMRYFVSEGAALVCLQDDALIISGRL